MRAILASLQEQYDYILIDSPPVLLASDAMLLSTMVDGVVLVANAQRTPKQVVREARPRLSYARAKILGVVLNQLHMRKGSTPTTIANMRQQCERAVMTGRSRRPAYGSDGGKTRYILTCTWCKWAMASLCGYMRKVSMRIALSQLASGVYVLRCDQSLFVRIPKGSKRRQSTGVCYAGSRASWCWSALPQAVPGPQPRIRAAAREPSERTATQQSQGTCDDRAA